MQTKIDKKLTQVKAFLDKNNIDFSQVILPVESEDLKRKVNGYVIETKNSFSMILPNFTSKKAEFVLLNNSVVEHLRSEGMSDDDIMEKQKIWKYYPTFASYAKTLANLEN